MSKQTPKLESVELIDVHTHAGKPYAKGETIAVSAIEKDWLIKHKKVAGPAAAQPTAKTKE